jgi:hypothetical protein
MKSPPTIDSLYKTPPPNRRKESEPIKPHNSHPLAFPTNPHNECLNSRTPSTSVSKNSPPKEATTEKPSKKSEMSTGKLFKPSTPPKPIAQVKDPPKTAIARSTEPTTRQDTIKAHKSNDKPSLYQPLTCNHPARASNALVTSKSVKSTAHLLRLRTSWKLKNCGKNSDHKQH